MLFTTKDFFFLWSFLKFYHIGFTFFFTPFFLENKLFFSTIIQSFLFFGLSAQKKSKIARYKFFLQVFLFVETGIFKPIIFKFYALFYLLSFIKNFFFRFFVVVPFFFLFNFYYFFIWQILNTPANVFFFFFLKI